MLLLVSGLVLGVWLGGISPSAQADSCSSLLADGGFESGNGWTSQTNGGYSLLSDYLVHDGAKAAYLAGVNGARDSLSAAVALPKAQSITLRFWWQVHSEESSNGYDGLSVLVADTSGNPLKVLLTLSDANVTDSWQQSASLDLSEFAGQSVQLQILAQTDQNLPTDFFIDDVELTACSVEGQNTRVFLPIINR